jgi:hypothetical protein
MGMQSNQKEFVYDLSNEDVWIRFAHYSTESSAKITFWNDFQQEILVSLQDEIDDGWTPITEIGPAGIRISLKKELFFHWTCSEWVWYVGFGLMTFGIGFFFPNADRVARPVEFRATLRRKK